MTENLERDGAVAKCCARSESHPLLVGYRLPIWCFNVNNTLRQKRLTSNGISKAGLCRERPSTIRSTLKILVDHPLLRQVTVETSRVFYDSNISPHHHFFDTDTGELKNIEAEQFEVLGMPEPPPGKSVAGVDVVVRLKLPGSCVVAGVAQAVEQLIRNQ